MKLIQINHELKDEKSFPLSEVLAYCARKAWRVRPDVVLEIGQLWMRETWTWMLKFQNPWFKVRQYGALPHFLCHVLNSVKNICVNILEHSRAQQDAYKPGFPQVFQYPASLTRKPMNSSSDENKKQQNEESSTPEGETNVLDASTVKCFPAVKRSFRQKQCNWRWRWKYFTR